MSMSIHLFLVGLQCRVPMFASTPGLLSLNPKKTNGCGERCGGPSPQSTPVQVQGRPAIGGWSPETVGTVTRNFPSGLGGPNGEDGGGRAGKDGG